MLHSGMLGLTHYSTPPKDAGFIALVSVLIMSALIVFLGGTLFRSALSGLSVGTFQEKSQQALFLADACLNEGVFRLKQDINYSGDENLQLNGQECLKIAVEDTATSTKVVSALVAAGDIPQHFQETEREIRYYIASGAPDWQNFAELDNLATADNSLMLAQQGLVERVTATSSQWEDFFRWSGVEVVADNLRLINTAEGFVLSGFRVSRALDLNNIKEVKQSSISWSSDEPAGTMIVVKTATSSDPNTEPGPANYVDAVNGDPIPGINQGQDLTGTYLWVRQELNSSATTTTPTLYSLTESISGKTRGHWISLPIDFSGQPAKVFRSQIFWEGDSFSEDFITLQVRTSPDGVTWPDWTGVEEVRNGGEIPGLERGATLDSTFLQIKASFRGGPDIYPALNKIGIFVELL